MEIKDLLSLLKRQVNLLVIGVVLGAIVGLVISIIQHPVYEATTKILVSQTRQQSNADPVPMNIDQLVSTYLQLVKTQPVLDDVSSQLGSRVTLDNIQVAAIANTQIIQLRVQDRDPKRAADIANIIFQVLVQQNEALQAGRYKSYEDSLNIRIALVQKQISDLQTQVNQINTASLQEQLAQVDQEIEQVQTEMSGLEQEILGFPTFLTDVQRATLAEKQARMDQLRLLLTHYQQIQTNLTYLGNPGQGNASISDPRLASLQSTLNTYQQLNLSLLNNLETVRLARSQNTPNLTQLDPAEPPKEPARPLPLIYVLLGSVVGLFLALAAILTLDHLDDSLKSLDQAESTLGTSVLGSVFESSHAGKGLPSLYAPFSTEAEAYRALGASIEIVNEDKSIHTLMILNAESGQINPQIAANLAVVYARQGKQVILVDGDIRSPHLHNLFGLENQKGLLEIINGKTTIRNACQAVRGIEKISLITGGITEKDSIVSLDANKIVQIFQDLEQQGDLVILDGPSTDIADAQILASKVDGVLLAVYAGLTPVHSARDILQKLKLIRANILGLIFNRQVRTRINLKNILPRAKIKLEGKGKEFYGDKTETDKAPISLS